MIVIIKDCSPWWYADIPSQLSDFGFLREVAFEDGPYDLALTGLEAVCDAGDRTDIVVHREEDEFLVDEL